MRLTNVADTVQILPLDQSNPIKNVKSIMLGLAIDTTPDISTLRQLAGFTESGLVTKEGSKGVNWISQIKLLR